MTGRSDLQPVREWAVTLASALDEVAAHVGATARRLADGWPDVRGQEWTDRLLLLRHTLHREGDAAAELGRAIDRVPDDTADPAQDHDHALPAGPRLGSTDARRADDERGVRIPRLDDTGGETY